MRLVPSVLAVPCWVWTQNEPPGCQTSSLHRPPHRWELGMFRRPSSPEGRAKHVKLKMDLKRRLIRLRSFDVTAPCAGCAPGWRHSRWWQTGSARASAGLGSPCGCGSAESADPRPGDGAEPTRLRCYRRTSSHHGLRRQAEATARCTSPGHQSLQKREREQTN